MPGARMLGAAAGEMRDVDGDARPRGACWGPVRPQHPPTSCNCNVQLGISSSFRRGIEGHNQRTIHLMLRLSTSDRLFLLPRLLVPYPGLL